MEDLTEVITAAEFHPHHCHLFVYSSSKGTLRLCDMRASALCDRHTKRERSFISVKCVHLLGWLSKRTFGLCVELVFEEPEDPGSRSFFSEIISSVSDVKFSHSGRYLLTRDYLTAKVWDLNMDRGPVETYQVRQHLLKLDFEALKVETWCKIKINSWWHANLINTYFIHSTT